MKKTMFFAATMAVLSSVGAWANVPMIDTITTVIDNPQQVIVTETPDNTTLRVVKGGETKEYVVIPVVSADVDSDIDRDINIEEPVDFECIKPEKKFEAIFSGLYAGWGGAKGDNTIDDLLGTQFEYGIMNLIGIGYKPIECTRLSVGVGFSWRNYNLKHSSYFDYSTPGVVNVAPRPATWGDLSSSLDVVSAQFPVEINQRIVNKLHVGLAVVPMWNFYADTHTHFRADHATTDIHANKLHQKPFSLDYVASLTWNELGVYFRYCPNEVLKHGYGPKIEKAWFVGVTLGI